MFARLLAYLLVAGANATLGRAQHFGYQNPQFLGPQNGLQPYNNWLQRVGGSHVYNPQLGQGIAPYPAAGQQVPSGHRVPAAQAPSSARPVSDGKPSTQRNSQQGLAAQNDGDSLIDPRFSLGKSPSSNRQGQQVPVTPSNTFQQQPASIQQVFPVDGRFPSLRPSDGDRQLLGFQQQSNLPSIQQSPGVQLFPGQFQQPFPYHHRQQQQQGQFFPGSQQQSGPYPRGGPQNFQGQQQSGPYPSAGSQPVPGFRPTGNQQPANTNTGSQLPTNTGNQRPTNAGSQLPTSTGSQRPTNTGSQRPANTGSQRPANTGSQRPANTGSQRPTNTGSQQSASGGSNLFPGFVPTSSQQSSNSGSQQSTSSGSDLFPGFDPTSSQQSSNSGSDLFPGFDPTSSQQSSNSGSQQSSNSGSQQSSNSGSQQATSSGSDLFPGFDPTSSQQPTSGANALPSSIDIDNMTPVSIVSGTPGGSNDIPSFEFRLMPVERSGNGSGVEISFQGMFKFNTRGEKTSIYFTSDRQPSAGSSDGGGDNRDLIGDLLTMLKAFMGRESAGVGSTTGSTAGSTTSDGSSDRLGAAGAAEASSRRPPAMRKRVEDIVWFRK